MDIFEFGKLVIEACIVVGGVVVVGGLIARAATIAADFFFKRE